MQYFEIKSLFSTLSDITFLRKDLDLGSLEMESIEGLIVKIADAHLINAWKSIKAIKKERAAVATLVKGNDLLALQQLANETFQRLILKANGIEKEAEKKVAQAEVPSTLAQYQRDELRLIKLREQCATALKMIGDDFESPEMLIVYGILNGWNYNGENFIPQQLLDFPEIPCGSFIVYKLNYRTAEVAIKLKNKEGKIEIKTLTLDHDKELKQSKKSLAHFLLEKFSNIDANSEFAPLQKVRAKEIIQSIATKASTEIDYINFRRTALKHRDDKFSPLLALLAQ